VLLRLQRVQKALEARRAEALANLREVTTPELVSQNAKFLCWALHVCHHFCPTYFFIFVCDVGSGDRSGLSGGSSKQSSEDHQDIDARSNHSDGTHKTKESTKSSTKTSESGDKDKDGVDDLNSNGLGSVRDDDADSQANSNTGSDSGEKINMIKERRKVQKITALLTAAGIGDVNKVQLITGSKDVDINSTDGMGRTCLHVACSEGHVELVRYLLKSNADPSLKDKNQNTPLNDAVISKKDKVAPICFCLLFYAKLLNLKEKQQRLCIT